MSSQIVKEKLSTNAIYKEIQMQVGKNKMNSQENMLTHNSVIKQY